MNVGLSTQRSILSTARKLSLVVLGYTLLLCFFILIHECGHFLASYFMGAWNMQFHYYGLYGEVYKHFHWTHFQHTMEKLSGGLITFVLFGLLSIRFRKAKFLVLYPLASLAVISIPVAIVELFL